MKQEYKMEATFSIDGGDEHYHLQLLETIRGGQRIRLKFTDVKIEKVEQRRHGLTKSELVDFLYDDPSKNLCDLIESILKDFDDDFKVEGHVDEEPKCTKCNDTGAIKDWTATNLGIIPCPECVPNNCKAGLLPKDGPMEGPKREDKPKCKTCGGLSVICEYYDDGTLRSEEPCPGCKPKPKCEHCNGMGYLIYGGEDKISCQVCKGGS